MFHFILFFSECFKIQYHIMKKLKRQPKKLNHRQNNYNKTAWKLNNFVLHAVEQQKKPLIQDKDVLLFVEKSSQKL